MKALFRTVSLLAGMWVAGLSLASCSQSNELADCMREAHKPGQKYLVQKCSSLAEAGNLTAQFLLAMYYYTHKDESADYGKHAHLWSVKAAESGSGAAATYAGLTHYFGVGTEPNYAEALRWFTVAARNGDHNSQAMLGRMLFEGTGGAPDLVQAYVQTYLSVHRTNAPLGKIGRKRADQLAKIDASMTEAEKGAAKAILGLDSIQIDQ